MFINYTRTRWALVVSALLARDATSWSTVQTPLSTQKALTSSKSSTAIKANLNQYEGLENTLFGRVKEIESNAIQPIAEKADSLSSPIRSLLSHIIETEQALNNMEHTMVSNMARFLLSILDNIESAQGSLTSNIVNDIPTETLRGVVSSAIETAKSLTLTIDDALLSTPALGPILSAIQKKAVALSPIVGEELGQLPPSVGILASSIITYTIMSTAFSIGQEPPESSPYPLGRYDPNAARRYFDRRIGEVVARGLEIAIQSSKFGVSILSDYLRYVKCHQKGHTLGILDHEIAILSHHNSILKK